MNTPQQPTTAIPGEEELREALHKLAAEYEMPYGRMKSMDISPIEQAPGAREQVIDDMLQLFRKYTERAVVEGRLDQANKLKQLLADAPKWRNGWLKEPVPYWKSVTDSLDDEIATLSGKGTS